MMPLLRIGSTPHGAEIEARVWVEGDLEGIFQIVPDDDVWTPDGSDMRATIERSHERWKKQNGRG